jgi:hypothetical protein
LVLLMLQSFLVGMDNHPLRHSVREYFHDRPSHLFDCWRIIEHLLLLYLMVPIVPYNGLGAFHLDHLRWQHEGKLV